MMKPYDFDMICAMSENEAKYIAIAAALRKDILPDATRVTNAFPAKGLLCGGST